MLFCSNATCLNQLEAVICSPVIGLQTICLKEPCDCRLFLWVTTETFFTTEDTCCKSSNYAPCARFPVNLRYYGLLHIIRLVVWRARRRFWLLEERIVFTSGTEDQRNLSGGAVTAVSVQAQSGCTPSKQPFVAMVMLLNSDIHSGQNYERLGCLVAMTIAQGGIGLPCLSAAFIPWMVGWTLAHSH